MTAGIAPEDPKLEDICVIKNNPTAAPAPVAINRLVPPRRDKRKQTIAPIRAIAVTRIGRAVRPKPRMEKRGNREALETQRRAAWRILSQIGELPESALNLRRFGIDPPNEAKFGGRARTFIDPAFFEKPHI